ncbi:MAG TPA: reverse transcriptase-like protein [Pyrinomonadaceae bacterium]|nr:reverse transcriptase-like protein [Pyrinomonadaceae bacterium]
MLKCPSCGSADISLVEKRENETLLVQCDECAHQWLRGTPRPEVAEATPPPIGERSYLLQTDGSGNGTVVNPDEGAIGVVLMDPGGNPVSGGEISRRIGPATNNIAEYKALIEGLRLAQLKGIKRIRVFLDSELVVDQINGVSQVNAEHLKPWHDKALTLFNQFPNCRISWVPRKWNRSADHLAARALRGPSLD